MKPDWTVEVHEHGILVMAGPRGGVPVDALDKATKMARACGYRKVDWHPGIASKYGAVFALGSKASLARWDKVIEIQNVEIDDHLSRWLAGTDRGISSNTIVHAIDPRRGALGGPHDCPGVPHDPGDFGRCYRLLEAVPWLRDQLFRVADTYPAWRHLVARWAELEALWLEESPTGTCPKLFDRLQELAP